jgi:hypothetical protein
MDGLIDVSNQDVLPVYVRFIDYCREDVKKERLCCLELKIYTTNILDEFIVKRGLQ